jgi:tripartite-type tricarboxylate transporter receptor subunit TctC
MVPFAPGGGTDSSARLIAQKLSEKWGQQVVVENKPGGNTVIASQAVAKAAPDGYTLLFANATFAINPILATSLPYDSAKEFTPVSAVAAGPFMMVVHSSVPANNLQQMLALMRGGKPGEWNFATVGGSGVGRIVGELFGMQAGVKMQHIPYKGASQVVTDMLAGQVKLTIDPPNVYISHIKSGKLKALAVTGSSRMAALPDVPTFAEAGMPDFDVSTWYGILATGGTPRPIVNKLAAAIGEVMAMPDVKERLRALELAPLPSGVEHFQSMLKSETERFARVVKAANIKAAD